MKPPNSPHARRTPGLESAALCRSTARDGCDPLGPESREEKRRGALFDGLGRVEFDVVDAKMEFRRDGGHANLAGHAGPGLDVAEYLVDCCAVDRKFLMHVTTPN